MPQSHVLKDPAWNPLNPKPLNTLHQAVDIVSKYDANEATAAADDLASRKSWMTPVCLATLQGHGRESTFRGLGFRV